MIHARITAPSGNVCEIEIERKPDGDLATRRYYMLPPSEADEEAVSRCVECLLLELFPDESFEPKQPAIAPNPVRERHRGLMRWAHLCRN